MKILGENIREFRENMHMSQEWLGRAVGVTKGAISNMENGKTKEMRAGVLEKMCLALSVQPSQVCILDNDVMADDVAVYLRLDQNTIDLFRQMVKLTHFTIEMANPNEDHPIDDYPLNELAVHYLKVLFSEATGRSVKDLNKLFAIIENDAKRSV